MARPAGDIRLNEVIRILDEDTVDHFCKTHAGVLDVCIHTSDCGIRPVIVGARSVAGTDYFTYDLTFAPGARRFEESVVSVLTTTALGAAVELLLEVGPDVIEERVLNLSARLAEGLAGCGCDSLAVDYRGESRRGWSVGESDIDPEDSHQGREGAGERMRHGLRIASETLARTRSGRRTGRAV